VFGKVVDWIDGSGVPALGRLGSKIANDVSPILKGLGDFIDKTIIPIAKTFGQVFSAAVEKIGNVVKQHAPEIRTAIDNVGSVLRAIADVAMPLVKFAFEKVLPAAIKVAIPIIVGITTVIAGVVDA